LLADGDVDALHALAPLVDDRVDRHGRLARLAVADDQLALAPADGRHGVDRLDAGLQRLGHRLAGDDAGRLHLEAAALVRRDGPAAVDGFAEGVDDAAEEAVADGDREDAARGPGRLALLDVLDVAEDNGADGLLV